MDVYIVGIREWHNQTTLHPLGLTATLVLALLILTLPRRFAVLPMILLGCFIPVAQRIVIMGNDFTLLRILVLFAWVRLLARNEYSEFRWNSLDLMVVSWKLSGTIIHTLAYGTLSAFINRCGWVFDGIGMYFFFRCVCRSREDIMFLARSFMLVSVPVAIAFLVERSSGRNMFSVFGGVPEITVVRDGKLRCQGAFSHAILAGCYWVLTMPWMIGAMTRGRTLLGIAGLLSGLIVVGSCASSTPVLALGFMAIGMTLYFVREQVRAIRWTFFLVLCVLHLIMEKPIWHLIARVNVVGGSTGFHRYKIMDATIENFPKWWLLGETNPMSWGVWEMRDVTNQYILEGLRGGLVTLLLFIGVIVAAFRLVGRALATEKDSVVIWSLGATLFVHASIFFSISYFGQLMMLWYLTLALIGSLPDILRLEKTTNSGLENPV
ncbi:MAG: hypothetical protein KF886_08180 [Candidatus Hydrogenedentes bacterium]|nr:hypothetical protein [Candidatus Hydrogenedentota bacterium]